VRCTIKALIHAHPYVLVDLTHISTSVSTRQHIHLEKKCRSECCQVSLTFLLQYALPSQHCSREGHTVPMILCDVTPGGGVVNTTGGEDSASVGSATIATASTGQALHLHLSTLR
jgi:hypothetical protein